MTWVNVNQELLKYLLQDNDSKSCYIVDNGCARDTESIWERIELIRVRKMAVEVKKS